MKTKIGNSFHFASLKNEELYTDPAMPYFSSYLHQTSLASQTIETYILSLHRYFMYSLYFENKDNLSFKEYIASYYKALKNGFEIIQKREKNGLKFTHVIFSSKKLADATIKKEFSALVRYYDYLADEKNRELFNFQGNFPLDIYYDRIDESYMRAKERFKAAKTGVNSLRLDGSLRKLYAKRHSIFKDFTVRVSQKEAEKDTRYEKAFPYRYFKDLIEIAEPQDQLIYILSGMASPRISQILNLTVHDIQFGTQMNGNIDRIWLCKPTNNERPVYYTKEDGILIFRNIKGRLSLLMEDYNIDPTQQPHSNYSSKYSIPVQRRDRSLWFFSERYKKLFFDLIADYLKTIVPISSTKHPFIFQTSTGGRISRNAVHTHWKDNLKKLQIRYPQYNFNTVKGIHSLRHMFGELMATVGFKMEQNVEAVNKLHKTDYSGKGALRQWQTFTAAIMGHMNINSTNIYFNINESEIDTAVNELQSLMGGDFLNAIMNKDDRAFNIDDVAYTYNI